MSSGDSSTRHISSSSSNNGSHETERQHRRSFDEQQEDKPLSGQPTSTDAHGVPRMPSAYSSSSGSGYAEEQEKIQASGSYLTSRHHAVRSPSSSSLSSHRSHPYPGRSDRPRESDLPRIKLPSIGSSYSSYAPEPSSVPPLSHLNVQEPSRPNLYRSSSTGSNARGVNLPPLHAIDTRRPSVEASRRSHPPSPIPTSRPVARSPSPERRSPGRYGLRPSYNYDPYVPAPIPVPPSSEYDRYQMPDPRVHHQSLSRHHAAPPSHAYSDPYHAHRSHPQPSVHSHRSHRHPSPQDYRDPPSPPLRHLPPEYHTNVRHPIQAGYYAPPGYHDPSRSRSHSSVPGQSQSRKEEILEQPGPGQNRRIAHLMSEQKRRESINTGFTALRQALPNSIPTDSKAIILRKAVSHIGHLEGLLRKAGINPGGANAPVLTPSSWEDDGERGDGGEGDAEDSGDIEMEREGWEEEGDEEKKYRRSMASARKARG